MNGLLQVVINRPDGSYVTDNCERQVALSGTPYTLDEEQTNANDNIAMIVTPTESEGDRLMELGTLTLPSGYTLEIPGP